MREQFLQPEIISLLKNRINLNVFPFYLYYLVNQFIQHAEGLHLYQKIERNEYNESGKIIFIIKFFHDCMYMYSLRTNKAGNGL